LRVSHLRLHLQRLDVLQQAAVGARQGVIFPAMTLAQLLLEALHLRVRGAQSDDEGRHINKARLHISCS